MNLHRLLAITMATLVTLGTLLSAMGQRSPETVLLVATAAAVSVAVTDIAGRFALSRNVVTLVALGLVAFYLLPVMRAAGEARILLLGQMMVYLQILLLFQKKDEKVFWWLSVMSLLQVIVAAGFNQGVEFGLMLVIYTLVGLVALALLLLYGEWQRAREAGGPPPALPPAAARWPLADMSPEFTSAAAGDSRSGVVAELFGRLMVVGAGTLFLATVFFLSVPRLGQPAWRGAMPGRQSVVGFADKVALGELGPILESRDEAMRVRLVDSATGQPYRRLGEIYLRGAVVTRYHNKEWSRGQIDRRPPQPPPAEPPNEAQQALQTMIDALSDWQDEAVRHLPGPQGAVPRRLVRGPTVLQRITVEPSTGYELFSIWPLIAPPADSVVTYEPQSQRVVRNIEHDLRGRRFTYELETTGLKDGRQVDLTPCLARVDADALLEMPELPRLTELAARWAAEDPGQTKRHEDLARLLERQFTSSGQFSYSLAPQTRDGSIDPIEDFVSGNPRGHCEYFATALALMLRSQGIPSRVVLGFRCDEWNEVGQFHQVRQLHAHAWVEAFLAPKQLPEDLRQSNPALWAFGGWLRLEPTPAGDMGTTAADRSTWGRWLGTLRSIESAWEDYVVEMDRQRQRQAIFEPLARALRNMFRTLTDPEWWGGLGRWLWDSLTRVAGGGLGGWLLAIALTLAAVALAAALGYGGWRLGRIVWRQIARRIGRRHAPGRGSVEFYRRFEHVLARLGLVRAVGQTPREFAFQAGDHLARRTGRPELAGLAVAVVEAFYRVRFGRHPLDNSGAQAVEHALAQLSAAQNISPLQQADEG